MSTITYSGFSDLAGRTFNTIQVLGIARRLPVLAWSYRCVRCGTSGIGLHTIFNDHMRCRNSSCGRAVAPSSSSGASVTQTPVGVRAADSQNTRSWRQQQNATQTMVEPTAEGMRHADPDSMRRYLDYRNEQAKGSL
jgi:hypothetical protein